ncbi:MAG: Glu-tRNA(Gln) amidotransferase subunit GatD [Candidatus Micrarchaeia archaeon]
MYSPEVEELLKRNGIKVGDVIRFSSNSMEGEGELMPRSEAGNPSILVIKLKNGYNIGIKAAGAKIEKIREGESNSASFPTLKLKQGKGLPKVTLIYTGGTIGSKIDYKTGGVYMLLKPEELFYEVPEISGIADISVVNLMSIASEDMSPVEWGIMANAVAKAFEDGSRGVVITHGTDTMHYTSSALSFMLKGLNGPVVLTGAQRSSDRGSSDAFTNLIAATALAARSNIAEVGICMHASPSDGKFSFLRGTKVRKMHTSRRDAFRPINELPLASVNLGEDIEIKYREGSYKVTQEKSEKLEVLPNFDSKVAVLKAYPGSDPEIVDHYVEKGYHGIIVEGTGLGHTPVSISHEGMSWLPHLKNAVEKGLIVGMTSQCVYGRVNPSVYRNLRLLSGAGVVYCEDMNVETAYVKLGWLLANFEKEKARDLLGKNMAGEIKSRSMFDEFLA